VFYHERATLRETSAMSEEMDGRTRAPEDNGPAVVESEPPSPSAPEFGVQPSDLRTAFLGPDGLRAGWGFAFYVAAFYPLQFVAARWANSLNLTGLWSMMTGEAGILVAAVLPALILAKVERRPWGVYGLPSRDAFGKLFWLGALWGFAGITVLLAAMYGLRVFDIGHLVLHGMRIVKFAVFWAVMFLLVGFFEEFVFRGYSQFTLTRTIGFWPSAALLSCAFGLVHLQNGGEQWMGLLAAAAIGFFFCLTLRRTGSLWFAVGFHAAWDWGETFFYSVPDSGTLFPGHLLKSSFHGPRWLTGGSAGPEGSVLCFLVVGALWFAFEKTYSKRSVTTQISTAAR
jgi:membrane protease YdiL (CAAX protease family)